MKQIEEEIFRNLVKKWRTAEELAEERAACQVSAYDEGKNHGLAKAFGQCADEIEECLK